MVNQAFRSFPFTDILVVGDGLATGGEDFFHDALCRGIIHAAPVAVAAKIIDNDLGAVLGQHKGIFTADAAPRARYDGHTVLAKLCHLILR